MIPTVYRISLDIHGVDSQGMLPVKAGDTARALCITLGQKGEPYPLTEDLQVMLTARKSDGTLLLEPCTITPEGIRYEFSSQLTAVAGEVLCELRLYGQEEKLLTSPRFSILVSDRVAEDEEIAESSSEFTALRELVDETRQIKEQWQALLESGITGPQLGPSLEGFRTALESYEKEDDTVGLPVLSTASQTYGKAIIQGTQEEMESESLLFALPTAELVQDLDTKLYEAMCHKLQEAVSRLEGRVNFDGGYLDEDGYLWLTLENAPIPGFTPIFVGKAWDISLLTPIPEDLTLEGDRLYLSKDGEPIGDGVTLPAGGGTGIGGGSVMKLLNGLSGSSLSIMDTAKEAMIRYSWSSVDSQDGSSTGKGSASWFVNDKRVAMHSVEQGEQSFDILPYLETGVENTVKLTVEDAYGVARSRVWTVTVISFGLSWDLEQMGIHASQSFSLRLVPTGMGEKTLYVTVDGEVIATETVATTGRTVTVPIPALSHGVHRISARLELVADGEGVSTEPLDHVGIWYEEGNNSPVAAFFHSTLEIAQYASVSLPYLVYDPLTENAVAELYEGERLLGSVTVDRGIQNFPYRPTEQGQKTLYLKVPDTDTQAQLPLTVTALGYDIAPVTSGLVLDCSPAGHTNSESGRERFGYTDSQGVNHPFLFSEGFDWVNGGFRQDEEGVTAFVIKRGSTVTLDRSFFDGAASVRGREIKLILKMTNCRDYEARSLTCTHQGVGLVLRAQEGILSSESQSLTFPYCEEEKLEIDLNIESTKESRLATVWLKGIPSGVMAYATSDSWAQADPQPVVLGSEDCDIWLYGMRMYDNSLTRYDILANYIADAGTTEEMISRYERNDIYNTNGTISLAKLGNANPDLRILHISAGDMTTSKTHEVSCNVELMHKNGKGFQAEKVTMKAQGTSSLEYGLAALNLDLDFSAAKWTDDGGNTITAFSMEESSIPVNYFNIKLNVASSENANNVCLAQEYNSFNPFRSQPRKDNNESAESVGKIRDTVEGHPCAVFLTNTSGSAITVGARVLAPGETILYGCGDMNNSKKNFAVFGQDNSLYPQQCCVEILNNNNSPCRFQSDDLSTETWDGEPGTSNFEFRYPKTPTAEMKEAFQTLLSWVVSTDPAQATGEELSRPVQFDGVTYNTDSAAFRLAKFRGELSEHFSVESLLFHYLFTEYHLMVDNRAKNCFLSYEWDPGVGGYRWNFNKDYDNDTAAGTDNSGGLSFHYGLEDTDAIGAQMVFNASDSVLWCNLRQTMAEELKAMFHTLESQKAWDTERLLEHFRTYQAARPETIVAEDMWAKYFMPYINKGEKRYLEMAQGTKENQRARFYRYRRAYMSSKYLSSYATADSLSLRINAVSDFTLTPYSDVYACVKFGNAAIVKLRGKRGQEILIPCRADTTNDLETYLYCAGSISRLGDLSGLQTSEIELNSARKLRNLPLGSDRVGYENNDLTQLSFGTIANLESIDLSGLAKLTGTLDLSQFDGLKELYAGGSGITGVIFAPNAPVHTAVLPRVGTLILRGQTKLKSLSLNTAGLMNLWVEDSPNIDTLSMVRSGQILQRGRLTKVIWDNADTDTLLRLADLGGYDGNGNPVDTFVLTGLAYVPSICQEELDRLHSTFPNLELSYGEIVPSYTVTFQNEDGSLLHTANVRQGGTCPDPVARGYIPTPTKAPTVEKEFYFAQWDTSLENITGNITVTAIFSSVTRWYTVRWFDGSRLLQTDVVEVYDTVSYKGEDLVSPVAEEIWIGWDQPLVKLKSVTENMDVYSVYMAPLEEVARRENYDYLYSDDPLDNSGYSLQEFYTVITKGLAKDYFQVGDEIRILTDNSVFPDREIILQVYGFDRYRLAQGEGFASVVFGMKGVMNTPRRFHGTATNAMGWDGSDVRKYLNQQVFDALPQQWRAMIKAVQVLGLQGGTSDLTYCSTDHLFLFSYAELFSTSDVPYIYELDAEADKSNYPLFTTNDSRIKRMYNGTGSVVLYFMRTPRKGSAFAVEVVIGNGSNILAENNAGVTTLLYLSFGFCI